MGKVLCLRVVEGRRQCFIVQTGCFDFEEDGALVRSGDAVQLLAGSCAGLCELQIQRLRGQCHRLLGAHPTGSVLASFTPPGHPLRCLTCPLTLFPQGLNWRLVGQNEGETRRPLVSSLCQDRTSHVFSVI